MTITRPLLWRLKGTPHWIQLDGETQDRGVDFT